MFHEKFIVITNHNTAFVSPNVVCLISDMKLNFVDGQFETSYGSILMLVREIDTFIEATRRDVRRL